MKKITVTFGAHDQATAPLRWAAELAHSTRTPLAVVNVFEPTYAEFNPTKYDAMVAQRRDRIETVVKDFADLGAEVIILSGHEPIEEIARYLGTSPSSLCVIGANGSDAAGGLGYGHPAHALLHHLTEPVAMIHADYEPIAGGVVTVGVDGSGANAVAVEWAEQFAADTKATLHAVFAYDPMDDTFTHPDGWHRHSDEVRRVVDKVSKAPVELFMAAGHPSHVLIEHARARASGGDRRGHPRARWLRRPAARTRTGPAGRPRDMSIDRGASLRSRGYCC